MALPVGAQDLEQMSVALEHVDEEEADAAVADAHGVGRPAIDVASMQEVGLQFRFGDPGLGLPAKSTNAMQGTHSSGAALAAARP